MTLSAKQPMGERIGPLAPAKLASATAAAAQHTAPIAEPVGPPIASIADELAESPLFDSPDYNDVADSRRRLRHGMLRRHVAAERLGPRRISTMVDQGDARASVATTSPAGTAQATAGVLGQTGTSVLFGDTGINDGIRSGGRFSAGGWMDLCHRHGLEVTYMVLEEEGDSFNGSNSSLGILARPFFNVQTGAQSSADRFSGRRVGDS